MRVAGAAACPGRGATTPRLHPRWGRADGGHLHCLHVAPRPQCGMGRGTPPRCCAPAIAACRAPAAALVHTPARAAADICCPYTSPQCKVQTGYQATKQYFDFTNNRCVAP